MTIPNSVTSIGSRAFSDCSLLTSVEIPNSVTSIGTDAFTRCGLINITLESETPPSYYSPFSEFAGKTTLIIPDEADIFAYLISDWRNFLNIEQINGDKIFLASDDVFEFRFIESLGEAYLVPASKYGNMTSASIPDRVAADRNGIELFYKITRVSNDAFKNCTKLTQVKIPANCEVVGSSAFEGCSALTSVNISDLEAWCKIDFGNATANPIYYAKNLCLNNDTITSLSIPSSISEIKNYAFYNCQSITGDLLIPGSVNSIGTTAFANIEVENCIIEDDIEALEFTGENNINAKNLYLGRTINGPISYSGLESLEVSGFVESIPSNCFSNNPLTTLVINPGSGVVIEEGAFKGCSQLAEITLPEDIVEIGANAFSGTALKNITIPNGTIGANAFANCNLDNIIIGAGVESIGEMAFDGSNAIKNVYATPTTPPAAENNTFSYYEAQLYVPQEAIDTYYNFTRCWYRFSGKPLVMPEKIEVSGPETISGNPGETFQLTATISPSNVTLDRVLWTSTNPAVATVDNDGLVTIHNFVSDEALTRAASAVQCQIIASTLYEDSPVAVVAITTNVEDTSIDYINPDESGAYRQKGTASNDIFTLQGVCLKRDASQSDIDALAPGIYIIGGKKVIVKN